MQNNDNIQITRLENGLTILTEKMPGLRSATVGLWMRRGSRHEPKHLNGINHFIEHAVFKGTARRSALDIAIESDRLGGNFDAYTAHETTGYSMKVVDRAVPKAFDLLSDMLANPRFEAEELRREQKVIIEEMKMVEDTPEEYLGEIFNREFFPNHPLGLPIEGTIETVSTFDRETTVNFHRQVYQPRNVVISAAGNVEHNQIVDLASTAFQVSGLKLQVLGAEAARVDGELETLNSNLETSNPPNVAAPIFLQQKPELEQAHILIATPWLSARDDRRYAASLLANVLGGGTSSRLWQSIREERGLAYSVGASAVTFADCGVFSVYAGTSPEQFDEVIDLSVEELRRAVCDGISADELDLVKQQSVASIVLGLESSSVRAGSLARQEIVHGKRISPDEVLAKIEVVTIEDLREIAVEFFQTEKVAVAALGDLDGVTLDRERLRLD